MEIYISTNGNDSNNGSIDSPLLTLEAARDMSKSGTTVYLRGGRYERRASFELLGEKNSKVTYKAYKDEEVILDGGIVIDKKAVKKLTDQTVLQRIIDENARNEIYEIDLKPYNAEYGEYGNRGFRRPYVPAPNELFINGQEMSIAQYPNIGEKALPMTSLIDKGSVPYDKEFDMRPAVFSYDNERCDRWKDAREAYVSGLFNYAWADDTIKIKEIKNRTITTTMPHLFGFDDKPHVEWLIINLLEEIDAPGEYYIDTINEKIYFYPKEDELNLIQMSVLKDPMIVMENTQGVSFENIIFENSRGSGVYIEAGSFNKIKSCIFRNLGMVAVQIGQGAACLPDGRHDAHGIRDAGIDDPTGQSRIIGNLSEMIYEFPAWDNNGGTDNGVVDCKIYNIGAGGILLGGGNRKKLIPSNNFVDHCEIYSVNRLDKTYKGGVNINGVGNLVTHCDMYNMPGSAIILHGNDNIIEYNKIHDVVKNVADAGAIYMGRDVSEVGNIFRHNFIYDLKAAKDNSGYGICAIYFDDDCIYNEVYGNYFYNIVQRGHSFFSTIFWNRGGETSIGNNVIIDCIPGLIPNMTSNAYEAMHGDSIVGKRCRVKDENDLTGVDITSDTYKRKYPYLYDTFVNEYSHGIKYWNNVVTFQCYSEYVDPENKNFTFKESSDAVRYLKSDYVTDRVHGLNNETVKFKAIDFLSIGLDNKFNERHP